VENPSAGHATGHDGRMWSSPRGVRWGVCLALTVTVALGGCSSEPADGLHLPAGPVSSAEAPSRTVQALAVLHRWDRQRAAAYAAGDAVRLRRLYVPGSAVGAADVRLLRRYAERGLVVSGMRRQVLRVHVRRWSRDRLVLRVTDRLVGAVAVAGRRRTLLPSTTVHRWELRFVRSGRRWLVALVRPSDGRR
jgi:hypothetical protein